MKITDWPVAVLAGTPVDTEMGADVLRRHRLEPLSCPVARTPLEQAAFQVRPAEEKRAALIRILRGAMAQGCRSAFIYCNSLSGAADFPSIAAELELRIVTPMSAFGIYARDYSRLAVVAYNGQALAGIDTAMIQVNPETLRRVSTLTRLYTGTIWTRSVNTLSPAAARRWCWAARTSRI